MAAHTLEGHRVLKVRKQFADEGQNHCWVKSTCSKQEPLRGHREEEAIGIVL
jgi:hypothetical protein